MALSSMALSATIISVVFYANAVGQDVPIHLAPGSYFKTDEEAGRLNSLQLDKLTFQQKSVDGSIYRSSVVENGILALSADSSGHGFEALHEKQKEFLEDMPGPRCTEGQLDKSIAYITTALNERGIAYELQEFSYKPPVGCGRRIKGKNIVVTLPATVRTPTSEEWVIVGAHYDTVYNSPGADDNASGVSSLLQVAKSLSVLSERKRSFYIVFFGGEERGLKGSNKFVSRNKYSRGKKLHSAHIVDTVGWSPTTYWRTLLHCAGDEMQNLYEDALKEISTELLKPLELRDGSSGCRPKQRLYSSDHQTFLELTEKKPGYSVLVSEPQLVRMETDREFEYRREQGGSGIYQRKLIKIHPRMHNNCDAPEYQGRPNACDTTNLLNYDYLRANTSLIVAAMALLSDGY